MPVRPRLPLTFPVRDAAEARAFHGQRLEFQEGRPADERVDFDRFGHRITLHLSHGMSRTQAKNSVENRCAAMRHFGVFLGTPERPEQTRKHQENKAKFAFVAQRGQHGAPAEQAITFVKRRRGDAAPFKAIAEAAMMFAQ